MGLIGVITSDFKAYHGIVERLRSRNIPFKTISSEGPIPPNVTVILTTPLEREGIDHMTIVDTSMGIQDAVSKAFMLTLGKENFSILAIGIDPGEVSGASIVGDDNALESMTFKENNDVKEFIDHSKRVYPAISRVIRVGHGDPTRRNVLINSLLGLGIKIEIVDETSTTKETGSHIGASINIARSNGKEVLGPYPVEPTDGELREIKRRSRKAAQGRFTISSELACRVAKGEMTMEEALDEQAR